MGARGRVREETGRGGRRGRGGGGRGRGGGGRGRGGGGRKLDKLGLYPRARVSRFRLPPGGHHRGDRAAPYGRGASPRERHGGAPQPPAAAAASSRQRPGLGGGVRRGRLNTRWGGRAPPNPRRTVAQGPGGLAFLSCPRGFLLRGPRAAAAPGSAPRHSPRRRRRRGHRCPASPGGSPVRAAALRPGAEGKTPTARPRGGRGPGCAGYARGRGGPGGGRTGAEGGRGPAGPGTCAAGAEEGTGRAGGGEQENVGEVLARERELA